MEPVFTLPYSEYGAANLLMQHFKRSRGYSLFVPVSRQEKGIDLVLTKRSTSKIAAVTFQVKSSRTYSNAPPKRSDTAHFTYYTWFNRFRVAREADFYLLFGLYPPDEGRTKKSAGSWERATARLTRRLVAPPDQVQPLRGAQLPAAGFQVRRLRFSRGADAWLTPFKSFKPFKLFKTSSQAGRRSVSQSNDVTV